MVLLICIDDRYGMLFNGRRQSRDSAVTDRILTLAEGKKLYMNSYSRCLFPETASVFVCEDFMDKASAGDYCFFENKDVKPYLNCAEKIILFRWNRKYPSDCVFPAEELEINWHLVKTEDFAGNSHERITVEEYCR